MLEHSLRLHEVSVVIPVYRGELTLPGVVSELLSLIERQSSPEGNQWRVVEIVLVHDHGPDDSAAVIRELASSDERVRPVWLSRNFGQHAATLAGMSSTGAEWVVTMDEDGQHDPRQIERLLDEALRSRRPVVYGEPTNSPPHGLIRNAASRTAKRIVSLVSGDRNATQYQSFRLMTGEIARSIAAYAGAGVYLDIALRWVAPEPASAPVELRGTETRPSGYTYSTLLSHFWRLIISSGTRGLRLVSIVGAVFAVIGIAIAIVLAVQRLFDGSVPEGWTSTIVVLLVTSGAIMFSLGVIAEYLGVAVNMAMGRPRYLVVSDPADGPLGSPPTSS